MKMSICVFVYACLLASCHKNTVTPKNESPDIYLSGYEFYPKGIFAVATYWKNGVSVHLTDGSTWSEARSIIVIGNDVYIAGRWGDSGVYWKNGIPTILTGPRANQYDANAIAVSGNDVYVAGTETGVFNQFPNPNFMNTVALYWKNGIPVYLSRDTISSAALSIAVSGNDVYTAGYSWNPVGLDNSLPQTDWEHYEEATYWKNTTPVFLSDGSTQEGRLNKIIVSGTDVYASGNILYDANVNTGPLQEARYWKNETAMALAGSAGQYTNLIDMTVSGNDTYVLGVNGTNNVYWKNGILTNLNFSDGNLYSNPKVVAASGNDVYISGLQMDPVTVNSYIDLWKNGTVLYPLDSTSVPDVLSIFVVNK